MLVATRLSVELALLATAIGVVLGLLLGATPALVGRRAGRLVGAAVNIAVAFPGLLLALFFAVIFGVGAKGAVLAIGLAGAPTFARLTHTLVAGIVERDFVAAARIAGVGRLRLLVRHVLPNIGEPLIVNATIGAGAALLAFAGLSFLGLGVQAPSYDWGRLLGDGLNGIYVHPGRRARPGDRGDRRRAGLQPVRRGGRQGDRVDHDARPGAAGALRDAVGACRSRRDARGRRHRNRCSTCATCR